MYYLFINIVTTINTKYKITVLIPTFKNISLIHITWYDIKLFICTYYMVMELQRNINYTCNDYVLLAAFKAWLNI